MSDLAISAQGHMPARHDRQALQQAAEQFEGVFVGMLLSSDPNSAIGEGPLGNSFASQRYRELFNQAISEHAAGSFGIADMLVDELSVRSSSKSTNLDHRAASPAAPTDAS